MINIKEYSIERKYEWNEFISNSENGTFLFNRDFMEYHADRFSDYSLMFYEEEDLIAVLPANLTHDKSLISHQGLTYGGLIFGQKVQAEKMLRIVENLINHCKGKDIKHLILKSVPDIFRRVGNAIDDYAFYYHNFSLIRRDLSSAVFLAEPVNFSRDRRYRTNKSKKNQLIVASTSELTDFEVFMGIVNSNLEKFATKAIHSTHQIHLLHTLFPFNLQLFTVKNHSGNIVAGAIVFIDNHFYHTQYLHSNADGKVLCAMEFLVEFLLQTATKEGKRYLSFGTSTEQNGRYLNAGLVSFKEGFGGKAFLHDFYELKM